MRTLVPFRDEPLAGTILETVPTRVLPAVAAAIALKHSAPALATSIHTGLCSVSDDISAWWRESLDQELRTVRRSSVVPSYYHAVRGVIAN
jgi:hypothetical protein